MDPEAQRTPTCDLQALFGVAESCTPDCLYFEQSGKPTVGCLFKNTSADMPYPIARKLLKSAGRRTR